MAYTHKNFKTKGELKEALSHGEVVSVYTTGLFPLSAGTYIISGPHYPEPPQWFAECRIDEALNIIPGSLK